MLRGGLAGLVIVLSLLASFVGISLPVMRTVIAREEQRRTVNVGRKVPDTFPVLVVYPAKEPNVQKARIVFHHALADFVRGLPEYSYCVPPGESTRLNAFLATRPSLSEVTLSEQAPHRFGAGRFEVQESGNAKQLMKVEGTWDDDRVNIGWYETDGRSITPKRYLTYFGPGLAIMALPISATITLGVWLAIILLIRRFYFHRSCAVS